MAFCVDVLWSLVDLLGICWGLLRDCWWIFVGFSVMFGGCLDEFCCICCGICWGDCFWHVCGICVGLLWHVGVISGGCFSDLCVSCV